MSSLTRLREGTALPFAAMFLSGVAALLFETLFFRVAGQLLGNSLAAASVILAAFMGGLSVGGLLAAQAEGRCLTSPLRAYRRLELTIGLAGAGVIFSISFVQGILVPLIARFAGEGWPLLLARACATIAITGVPAAAMGATLPLLIRGVGANSSSYGGALAGMYALNTLGAFAGALSGEWALIPTLGLRGTALCAAGLNAAAAALTLPLGGASDDRSLTSVSAAAGVDGRTGGMLLATGAAAGFFFLALEVVWFRFLALFVFGSSLDFAAMLATLLAGIGCGAILVRRWLQRTPLDLARATAALFLCGGVAVALGIRLYPAVVRRTASWPDSAFVFAVTVCLVLPASLCSGALFPVVGANLRRSGAGATAAAGRLFAVNTGAGVVGSLAAGYLVLPRFGMERGLALLAVCYALCAAIPLLEPAATRGTAAKFAAVGLVSIGALFPWGTTEKLLDFSAGKFLAQGERRVAWFETPGETLQVLRKDLLGQPFYYRLLSDSNSMSATNLWSRRYMTLFAALPLALHPQAHDALLICYGCGTTAKALVQDPALRAIDVVDTSRETLALGDLMFPGPRENPLHDPRVRVHVEDGRFFLRAPGRRYDLITGEPPPPKARRVGDLYSRDFFSLVAARLKEGGIATYWLPVGQLTAADAKAIVAGFCEVFPECSLWMGDRRNWVLMGVRGGVESIPRGELTRLWTDPRTGPSLEAVGLLGPEYLASLYLAGGTRLARWVAGTPPLTDNHPGRLTPAAPLVSDIEEFSLLLDFRTSWEDFSRRRGVAALWPVGAAPGAGHWFAQRDRIGPWMFLNTGILAQCLDDPGLRPFLPWIFGSDTNGLGVIDDALRRGWLAETAAGEELLHVAAHAVLAGNYSLAAEQLARASTDPWFAAEPEFVRHLQEVRALLETRSAGGIGPRPASGGGS